jgi:hypothetical protein
MSLRRLRFLNVAIIASAVTGCTAAFDVLAPNPVNLTTGSPAAFIFQSETRSAACSI